MPSLERLAERFESKAAALAELSERYEIRVWLLGHSDNSDQHGFAIKPETMRRLGLLSAAFFPDVYGSSEQR